MNWKQRALYSLMSDISEECYCAGWINGNEFVLWDMVSNASAVRSYGMHDVSDSDLADLKAISDEVGGWVYWHDDNNEPDLPAHEWGARFIPMSEWLVMFEKDDAIYRTKEQA